jgi:hypothetical protein
MRLIITVLMKAARKCSATKQAGLTIWELIPGRSHMAADYVPKHSSLMAIDLTMRDVTSI